MSWIVAVIGPPEALARGVAAVHAEPRHHVLAPGIVLAAGGPTETLHARYDADGKRGFVVAGTGLRNVAGASAILSTSEWGQYLERGGDPSDVEGHFVGVRWEPDRVVWFSDALGQRDLFTFRHGEVTVCSTRLDWLARTIERPAIDLEALGSRWLCFHSFTSRTGLASVERLGPSGRMVFHRGREVSRTSRPFDASFGHDPSAQPIEAVAGALTSTFRSPYVPSLGLSGGLDSRLLLATLMRDAPGRFVAHTFGALEDPDVALAVRLAGLACVEHVPIVPPLAPADELVMSLKGYAAATHLTEPVTSAARLAGYEQLVRQHRVLVDGGFGELLRRQYLNRLAVVGTSALRRRDARSALPFVRTVRAEIFRPDARAALERGAVDALAEAFAGIPPDDRLGPEDAADLLAVRTRIPHYGGPEQARLDGLMLNLMPLGQPSTIRAAFALPVRMRRNARWVVAAIRQLRPALASLPLVKGGSAIPFGLPMILSRTLASLRSRFGSAYHDDTTDRVLQAIWPYVRDVAASSEVRRSALVDSDSVDRIVQAYERGDRSTGPAIAWWLTFEWWSRSMTDRSEPVHHGGQVHVSRPPAA